MAQHDLLEKLEGLRLRFLEVSEQITNPEVIADTKRYVKLNKEYSELEKVVEVRNEFENTLKNIESTKEMLKEETDPEMKEMAKMELDELEAKLPVMEEEIKVLLIPA
ncbi:MAG: PCRF domain-containing protein, partial [Carboxylicivirga sp.]|nr:PCRF domain-containing protein [Carboxylicivirga sp.]